MHDGKIVPTLASSAALDLPGLDFVPARAPIARLVQVPGQREHPAGGRSGERHADESVRHRSAGSIRKWRPPVGGPGRAAVRRGLEADPVSVERTEAQAWVASTTAPMVRRLPGSNGCAARTQAGSRSL